MNRIFYAFIALMALASCANSYDISGTSNVSTLDGRMLYLKILENNDFKNVDSCDVVHGQFHFQGSVDSMKMANIFMDDDFFDLMFSFYFPSHPLSTFRISLTYM